MAGKKTYKNRKRTMALYTKWLKAKPGNLSCRSFTGINRKDTSRRLYRAALINANSNVPAHGLNDSVL